MFFITSLVISICLFRIKYKYFASVVYTLNEQDKRILEEEQYDFSPYSGYITKMSPSV